MRKKWTYVAVACMLLGTAPVFTGCIDTDEPAGLEDLRGAKSELLRAKAAVEAARVAEVQAQAALLQAQAKVEEANAVKVQAEAEKIKAEAAIAQAKADYINAKTEQAKAEAQAVIDENNRIQAEWEAEAAVRQAEAEAAIKQAQLATAEALAKYQTVVAALQDTKNKALQPYIAKLNKATQEYYDALDELTRAQRVYNQQVATVEENEASKNLMTRDLQREVMLKQKGYDGAVAALERANAELEEAKTIQPSELAVKYDEVKDEMLAIQKEIADLSVEAAEKAVEIFNKQVVPYRNLVQELEDLKNEPQTIAAVTFDFSGDGSSYPSFVHQGTFEMEEMEYTYNDPSNLALREANLHFWLDEFKSWTRDENDNAWTNERIVTWEGQIKGKQETLKEYKKSWLEAVKAYQANVFAEVDRSQITGYDDVAADIKTYNEKATAYNNLSKEIATLIAQEEADRKTRDAIVGADGSAWTTYNTTMNSISEEYDPLQNDIPGVTAERRKALQAEYDEAQKNVAAAETAAKEAEDAYNKLQSSSTDPDEINVAYNTWRAAQNKLTQEEGYRDAAWKALNNCTEQNVLLELQAERKKEEDAAWTAYNKALTDANKAYDDKWGEKGTQRAELDKAYTDIETAQEAVATAVDDLKVSGATYNDNLSEINPIDMAYLEGLKYPDYQDVDATYPTYELQDDESVIVLSKTDLLRSIQSRAEKMIGIGAGQNDYGDNYALLAEMTDEEINEMILAKVDEAIEKMTSESILQEDGTGYDVTLEDYVRECNKYGVYGEILGNQERIRIAKTWLNNADVINAKIKQAEDALAALEKGYDTLKASIEAKEEERDLAYETLIADLEDTYLAADQKRVELEPLQGLLGAIKQAIADYNTLGDKVYGDETVDGITGIEDYIAQCQKTVENITLEVFDAETLLLRAQDNLNKWNNDAITALEIYANDVADAQVKVDRKKAQLEDIQAALDAVIAALTNDPTASVTDTPATEE